MFKSGTKRSFRDLIIYLMIFSILASLLPLYIFSAEQNEEYSLPWLWPVPGSYCVNGLDYYYSGNPHGEGASIDIGANGYTGDTRLDVVSATSGEVFYIRDSYDESTDKGSGWGNYVIVKSGNTYIVYGHLQSVSCSYGKISAGDMIGKMGCTGNATGVHLHMQAYPVGQGPDSTDVYALDEYLYNPYYYSKLKFYSGLEKYSVRYGEHISSYYKTLSGGYYTYSGGYVPSYNADPLYANVTAIRVAGARVYSAPDNLSNPTSTVTYLDVIPVYGVYTDAYGKMWYMLSQEENKWIPETDVAFHSYKFGAESYDVSFPDALYASFYNLTFEGRFEVRNIITSLKAEIVQGEEVLSSHVYYPNSSSFEVENRFNNDLFIDYMEDGEYSLVITITETASFPGADTESHTYEAYRSDFEISSVLADKVAPSVEDIKIEYLDSDKLTLSVVSTDNGEIGKVYFTITSSDNSFSEKFSPEFIDGRYVLDISVSELNGSGKYTVTANASDWYNNKDSSALEIYVPQAPSGEKWKIQVSSSLQIRSGPATSYSKVGKLYNGNIVTITYAFFNTSDNRHWAKISSGWISIDYAAYQSGYLNKISFNLNGGEADIPEQINKRYSISTTIPDVVPAKKGYTFIGWAKSPDSKVADYQPGDTYSSEETVVLFAIWQDGEAPVVSGVTPSITDFTKDNVILNVNATDNSDKLFYSFDGGISWTKSPSIILKENVEFSAGTIQVKDAYGNVTVYDKKISVTNIDKVAPVPSDTPVDVSVIEGKVKLTFSSASDDLSGVESYVFKYSQSRDMSGALSKTVTSGSEIPLSDGVYYAELIISDKVGNCVVVPLSRFLVGNAVKLSSPESFLVLESSNFAVVFGWDAVPNADAYQVIISDDEIFDDPIFINSYENSATVTVLSSGKLYYAKVVAITSDGVYLQSDPSDVISFETVSSDNNLYGMVGITDAVIDNDNNEISAVIPYSDQAVNLICRTHSEANVKFFTDIALSSAISVNQISSYPFTESEMTIYIEVTAQNGSRKLYTLSLVRVAYSAEAPTVNHANVESDLFVNRPGEDISLSASVTDGGQISVEWFVIYNDSEPYVSSQGNVFTPLFTQAGTYKVYAVVTNKNEKCYIKETSTTTAVSIYNVEKNIAVISVECSDFVYNGNTPAPLYSNYYGDGTVTYKYFSDFQCQYEIEVPTNAGVYYVIACASETDEYLPCESEAHEFEIFRADNLNTPEYTVTQPSLRDRNGYVLIESNGLEYSLNGGAYLAVSKEENLKFDEGDIILIRFAETNNYEASDPVTVRIENFTGTDGFYPDGSISITEKDGYLLIDKDTLKSSDIISALTKTENIVIYSHDGNEMSDSDGFVYTSCVIAIVDSQGVYKSLTVVILGDINFDGEVTYDDVDTILCISNGMLPSATELQLLAGDLDGDNDLSSVDSYLAYLKTK